MGVSYHKTYDVICVIDFAAEYNDHLEMHQKGKIQPAGAIPFHNQPQDRPVFQQTLTSNQGHPHQFHETAHNKSSAFNSQNTQNQQNLFLQEDYSQNNLDMQAATFSPQKPLDFNGVVHREAFEDNQGTRKNLMNFKRFREDAPSSSNNHAYQAYGQADAAGFQTKPQPKSKDGLVGGGFGRMGAAGRSGMVDYNDFDFDDDNEWPEGAVKCKEKKHSKVVGNMKITRVIKVFQMRDGKTEVIENTLKELIG